MTETKDELTRGDIDELEKAKKLIKEVSDYPQTPDEVQTRLGVAYSKVNRVQSGIEEESDR